MAHSYRFGDITIDPESFRLLKADKALPVEPKALNLLIFLVERRGRLVERRELLNAIWGDAFVTDHVLNRAIGQLRKVLADDAKEPRYIETVPTLGYRFIADVATVVHATSPVIPQPSTLDGLSSAPQSIPSAQKMSTADLSQAWVTRIVALLLFGFAAALAAWHFHWFAAAPMRSLAVIPLENLSGDPAQDYLADGMTDQLIANLGQIGALRVVSQTTASQYKRAHKPLPQIARELNVDAVVEGSVFRSGNRLRIVAQLVNATTEQQIWSDTYDGDLRDVMALENQVASAIVERVRVKLTQTEQARLSDRQEVDPQAYELLLKGNYFFEENSEETTRKSLQYFQRAVALDPKFARAYVGIARSYNFLGDGMLPAGEATAAADSAIAKAMQLQPDLAAAYAERGWTRMIYHLDFPGTERDFRHALLLEPGLVDAHEGYGNYLVMMGRFKEGLKEMKQARDLSPLSPIVITDYCNMLRLTRHYADAQVQCAAALELNPNYEWALSLTASLDYFEKDYAGAHAAIARLFGMNGQADPVGLAMADEINGVPGRTGAFDAWLKTQKDPDPLLVAAASAMLGRKDVAFAWLEKTYARRADLHGMAYLNADPDFDSLRSDPRFNDFLRRVGLPPQQRETLVELNRIVPN